MARPLYDKAYMLRPLFGVSGLRHIGLCNAFFEKMQIVRHKTSRDVSPTGIAVEVSGYVSALFVLWSYRI
jgi:hypothetical protein